MSPLPPKAKIYEAYSAIVDGRVSLDENEARVMSSNAAKIYTVTWADDVYTSNDSATYWQGYAGYPILAVLMMQGRLPFDGQLADHFGSINWTELNEQHKADYDKAVDEVLAGRLDDKVAEEVRQEVERVYLACAELEVVIKRGKAKPTKLAD